MRSKRLSFLKPCTDPVNKDPTHHQRNQHDQIKMWEKNSDPLSFGFGNDDDKIPAKAFLSWSQSSTAEGTDRGTITVDIVYEYAIYGGRERDGGGDPYGLYFRFLR